MKDLCSFINEEVEAAISEAMAPEGPGDLEKGNKEKAEDIDFAHASGNTRRKRTQKAGIVELEIS